MLGTIVNAASILVGGFLGLLLRSRLKGNITDTVLKGLSLVVIYIGISGSLQNGNVLITVLSISIGGAVGAMLDFDGHFTTFADKMQNRLVKQQDEGNSFGQGFAMATLVFCVGAMAIVGSLNSGLKGDHEVLFAKSLIDGISAAMFAAALGPGVLASAVPVFLYQGAITLLSKLLAPLLSDVVIAEMTCVGSILIMGLGLNLLGVTKLKIMNYVLAIFLPIGLCLIVK